MKLTSASLKTYRCIERYEKLVSEKQSTMVNHRQTLGLAMDSSTRRELFAEVKLDINGLSCLCSVKQLGLSFLEGILPN